MSTEAFIADPPTAATRGAGWGRLLAGHSMPLMTAETGLAPAHTDTALPLDRSTAMIRWLVTRAGPPRDDNGAAAQRWAPRRPTLTRPSRRADQRAPVAR